MSQLGIGTQRLEAGENFGDAVKKLRDAWLQRRSKQKEDCVPRFQASLSSAVLRRDSFYINQPDRTCHFLCLLRIVAIDQLIGFTNHIIWAWAQSER